MTKYALQYQYKFLLLKTIMTQFTIDCELRTVPPQLTNEHSFEFNHANQTLKISFDFFVLMNMYRNTYRHSVYILLNYIFIFNLIW